MPEPADTAVILAAGLGVRMRPTSLHTPKPLLAIGATTAIEYQLARLKQSGIARVWINLHWLGDQLVAHLGDGSRHGLEIRYLREPSAVRAWGQHHTVFALSNAPALVCVSADLLCNFDLGELCRAQRTTLTYRTVMRAPYAAAVLGRHADATTGGQRS